MKSDGWHADSTDFSYRYQDGELVEVIVRDADLRMERDDAGNWSISIRKVSNV